MARQHVKSTMKKIAGKIYEYAALAEEKARMEELSRGWPESLEGHPLHSHHPLRKTFRRTFSCDSCHTAGVDWSFHCAACDLDLHPDCAQEAQLVDMAKPWPRTLDHRLHREHPLVKTRVDSYWCDSCGERGSWWCFYCERCDFSLHLQCAVASPKTARATDEQQPAPLVYSKTAMESYYCSKCAEEGKGVCYQYEDFDVILHPRCAAKEDQWPRSVVHELDRKHELVKWKVDDGYTCNKCWLLGKGWCYGCKECGIGLHPRCATMVKEAERGASWVEQMAETGRQMELVRLMLERIQLELQREEEEEEEDLDQIMVAREIERMTHRNIQDILLASSERTGELIRKSNEFRLSLI